MSLAPGTKLGPYEIVGPLGAGGMGEVYRATDTRLSREVAIKVLPSEISDDARALARFEREAKAIAALSHPNVLAIYDVGRERGIAFTVTELLDGQTLRARLEDGALPPQKAVAYAIQLAEGLAAAHERGVIHRDIKPENVFITADGRVKLLDFGLAKTLEPGDAAEAETRLDPTKPHTVLGTVAYMSPEQVRGEPADARSDVFSFGVVLYEMLSGERTFTGQSAADIMSSVLRDEPRELSTAGVVVPPRLERSVGRCLEKRPGERFQSARDLAFALSTFLEGQEAAEREPEATEISVVVLPFANLSPNEDDEFLADGFTEEAISDLSAIQSLAVISRTSSMRLKGTDKDSATIAAELGVQYVLEGSVQPSGEALRVTARLVDARADRQLWTERYTGDRSDIFSIQEQVARGIVDALRLQLTPQEERALAAHAVTDPRAYESYLRARSAIWAFNPESLKAAQRHLENALELVGENELLLASLGHVYTQYGLAGAPPELDGAQRCADRIIALNRDSPWGVWLRAFVLFQSGELRRARPVFEQAHCLLPDDPDVLIALGYLLSLSGIHDRAEEFFVRVLEVDPLTPLNHGIAGFNHVMAGQPEEAIPGYRRFHDMEPENPLGLWSNAWVLLHAGLVDEARPWVERLEAVNPASPYSSIARAQLWGCLGERDKAFAAISPKVVEIAADNEMWSRELTHCYALAGRADDAIRWFENTVRIGTINYPFWAKHDRMLDNLRADDRFHGILERVRTEWAEGVSPEEAAAYPAPQGDSLAGEVPAAADATVPDLGLDAGASATPATSDPLAKLLGKPAWIAVVALAVVLAVVAYQFLRTETPEPSAGTIAIMPFENLADPEDEDQLAGMLTLLVQGHVAESDRLIVVSGLRLYDIQRQISGSAEVFDPSLAAQIAQAAGAGTMVVTRVDTVDGETFIIPQVLDPVSGAILGQPGPVRAAGDVFELALATATELLPYLLPSVAEAPALVAGGGGTASEEALRAYNLGEALLRAGELDQAIAQFAMATDLDPDFHRPWFQLGLWAPWTDVEGSAQRQAVDRLEALIDKFPAHEQPAVIALQLYLEGNLTGAARAYEEHLSNHPDDKYASYQLGEVYAHSARDYDPARALEAFERALDLDPSFSLAFMDMPYLQTFMGNPPQARQTIAEWEDVHPILAEVASVFVAAVEGNYQPGLDRDPDSGSAFELGQLLPVYALLGSRWDLAEEYIAAGATEDSNWMKTLTSRHRGDLAVYRGRFAEAEAAYAEAGRANDYRPYEDMVQGGIPASALRALAELLALQGDTAGARVEADRALSIQPESPRRLYFAGRFALLAGEPDVAADYLRTIEGLLPRMSGDAGWIYRDALQAELAIHDGRPEAAVLLLDGVLESGVLLEDFWVDWSTGPIAFRDALSRAHEALDNRRRAVAVLELALDTTLERLNHPVPNILAYYRLGVLHDELGDAEASTRYLHAFLEHWGTANFELAEVADARARLSEAGHED